MECTHTSECALTRSPLEPESGVEVITPPQNAMTRPVGKEAVYRLMPVLQEGDSQRTLECDLPHGVNLNDLSDLELHFKFVNDRPNICMRSEDRITAERMKQLRMVLEDLMSCYCYMTRTELFNAPF